MGARTVGTLIVGAMLWAGAAQAQAPGTPGGGSSGTSGTGSGSTGTGSGTATTGGATASGGGLTFDPLAAAAARLFGSYRVPGAAPLDTSGVYRVDTGSSPPAAGSGGGSSGTPATGSTTTTNTTTSGSGTSGGATPTQ
jgi:hypothetical protein